MARRPVVNDPQLLLKDAGVIRAVTRRVFASPLLANNEERAYVFRQLTELSDLLERRAMEAQQKKEIPGDASRRLMSNRASNGEE